MTSWRYYDAKGNRTPENRAKFKAKEVRVEWKGPTPPEAGTLASHEYHDAQAIGGARSPKKFTSERKLKAWFAQQPEAVGE